MTRNLPHKTVACVGTLCGGSTWAAQALQAAGLHVRHEKMGNDGISCGWFAWTTHINRKYRPEHYTFEHVVRLIRHPLHVAETLPQFARDHHGPWSHDDPRVGALRWWVLTHERLDVWKCEHLLRIGQPQQREDWRRLAEALQLAKPEYPRVPINRRTDQRWPRPTWEWWHIQDPDFAERGRTICERFELEQQEG